MAVAGILGASAACSEAVGVAGVGAAGAVTGNVSSVVRRTICPVCNGLWAKAFNCAALPAPVSGVFEIFWRDAFRKFVSSCGPISAPAANGVLGCGAAGVVRLGSRPRTACRAACMALGGAAAGMLGVVIVGRAGVAVEVAGGVATGSVDG